MAKTYKPNFPYGVPAELYAPTGETIKRGVPVKTYSATGARFNCSFRTFGGTESTENGLLSVIDTAVIETWYRPDIQADCRIKILSTGKVYVIIGTPENIQLRNQYMTFRVRAVEGGA